MYLKNLTAFLHNTQACWLINKLSAQVAIKRDRVTNKKPIRITNNSLSNAPKVSINFRGAWKAVRHFYIII